MLLTINKEKFKGHTTPAKTNKNQLYTVKEGDYILAQFPIKKSYKNYVFVVYNCSV